jgi:hypothetical protein
VPDQRRNLEVGGARLCCHVYPFAGAVHQGAGVAEAGTPHALAAIGATTLGADGGVFGAKCPFTDATDRFTERTH